MVSGKDCVPSGEEKSLLFRRKNRSCVSATRHSLRNAESVCGSGAVLCQVTPAGRRAHGPEPLKMCRYPGKSSQRNQKIMSRFVGFFKQTAGWIDPNYCCVRNIQWPLTTLDAATTTRIRARQAEGWAPSSNDQSPGAYAVPCCDAKRPREATRFHKPLSTIT